MQRVRLASSLLVGVSFAIYIFQRNTLALQIAAFMLRTIILVADVARGLRPWPRILIPTICLVKLLIPSFSFPISSALIELLVLALLLCVLSLKTTRDAAELPEDRLATKLSLLLPPLAARLMAVEIVVLSSAVRSLFSGFRMRQADGFHYASASVVWALPVLVLVSAPGDIFLLRQLLHVQNPLVDWALAVLDVWSVLWLYGVYVTMRERPHTLRDDVMTVHQGILKSARFTLAKVQSAHAMPAGSFKRSELRGAKLTAPGAPCVRVDLSGPINVKRIWRLHGDAATLFVSAAAPDEFAQALDPSQGK